MSTTPTKNATMGQFYSINKEDFLHLLNAPGGNVIAWIDGDGILQGVLGPSYGELTITANATPLTMASQSTYYKIGTGWASDQVNNVTIDTVAGTMTAVKPGPYFTVCTVAFTSGAAPETVQFGIFKNGNLLADHTAITWTDTNTYPNTITMSGIDTLVAGDVLDVRVQCTTAASVSLTPTNVNFSVFSL